MAPGILFAKFPGISMQTLLQDLRQSFRMLAKSRGFTVVAVLTLALGIGANTAIFSVVNSVLLRPLPFHNPNQLVFVTETSKQREITQGPLPVPDYLAWKERSRSFAGIAATQGAAFTYTGKSGAIRINGALITPEFLRILGLRPILGRVFSENEGQPGRDQVVIMTEALWRRQFGADPNIIGRDLRIDSRQVTVVGVIPSSASVVTAQNEMLKPLAIDDTAAHEHVTRLTFVIARLRDGISIPAAQAEMDTISTSLEREFPSTNTNWRASVDGIVDSLVGPLRPQLWLLLAAVATVLLIGCVNLATLLSARIGAREKEVATRVALGATRRRLVRQFLTESLLLGILGGGAGVLLAFWSLPILVNAIPQGPALPQGLPRVDEISIDAVALAYTLLISLAAGIVFGIRPAFDSAKTDLNSVLREAARGSSVSSRRSRFRDALIVAEVALSMMLLVGAGLLVRSFIALRNTDPGFKADHVLVATQLVLPPDKYDKPAKSLAFFRELLEHVRALPGVKSAGGITALPLQANSQFSGFRIAGLAPSVRGEMAAVLNTVTDGYFQTMRVPLRNGRLFTDRDNEQAPKVAVVNEALVRRHFGGRDPIGQHLFLPNADNVPVEIVGVVGNTKQFGLNADPSPEIFTPFLQGSATFLYLLVRTGGDPSGLFPAIRREVAAIDPDQPVGARTLDQQLSNAIAQPRFLTELLGLFAALAVILAIVGIYGVTSYSVAQRTHEIGIRMALGAPRASVVKLVVGRAFGLSAAGIAVGALASLALTRMMSGLLYGVTSTDPLTFLNVSLLLLVVAFFGSVVPAGRAARTDALIAMRYE
jgi:putative ABC transport system permease protein